SLSTYEVWQKEYDAGRIRLGINGFDKHRPVYYIRVEKQAPGDDLQITPILHSGQHYGKLEEGAFTYHDWDGLTLTEIPDELKGQTLFTTIRGRAREAHLVGAFRNTAFPSSEKPDQVLLTWSDDVRTTMDVQWRSSSTVSNGQVAYWAKDSQDTLSVRATSLVMEDRLLQNDRFVHRFTAMLTGVNPGISYEYLVGGDTACSDVYQFSIGESDPSVFCFLWTGDFHNSKACGELMHEAYERHA